MTKTTEFAYELTPEDEAAFREEYPPGSEENPLLCGGCVYVRGFEFGKCFVFPQGIPEEIMENKFQHDQPYPPNERHPEGDGGRQFISGDLIPRWWDLADITPEDGKDVSRELPADYDPDETDKRIDALMEEINEITLDD